MRRWIHGIRWTDKGKLASMPACSLDFVIPATDPFHSSLWWRGERQRRSHQLMLEVEAHTPHSSLALWSMGRNAYVNNKLKRIEFTQLLVIRYSLITAYS